MATKSDWMVQARKNAQAQDERDRKTMASRTQSRLDAQSAQVASRLDNVINSPSVSVASNQRSAQIANRLNTGAVTPSSGRQAQIVQAAKDYKKSQGGTLMEQATSMNFADSVKPDLTKIMPTAKIVQASFTNPSGKDYYGAEQDRKWYNTVWDTIGAGAGKVNQGAAATLDFAANLIPRLEGELFGATPESTVSGQLLRPVTDATGKLKDYVNATTTGLVENINEDTKDSKAANIAVNLGSDVIAAVPNAVLAYLSAGQSAAAQLGAQSAGVTGTISTAATKMLQNPMFKYSFAQSIGSSFDEAKAAGATDAEAMTAATISSLFNAAIETSGGIEALPDNLRGVDLSTQDKVLSWLSSIPQEGFEEVVQGVVTGLTNKLTFDEGKALYSPTDENAVLNPGRMWQEFGTGSAVAGILGGGQLGANLIGSNINANKDPIGKALEQQKQQNTTQPTGEERVAQVVQDLTGQTEKAPANTTPAVTPAPVAEYRQTASEILDSGVFDSPTYGEALQETGMKRADVRQALRKIAQNTPGAALDYDVQTVIGAIETADVKTPTPVQTEQPEAVPLFRTEHPAEAPVVRNSEQEAQPAMGAADYGFSPYSNYQNTQDKFLPEGANAARPVDVPTTDPTGQNTRRFASNAMGAQTVPDRAVPTLEGAFMEGRLGYEVKGDKKAVAAANELVSESYDRAYARTIERLQSMKNLKQTVVDAEVLISKAYQEGRDADAAELILLLAESGTEFGQAVQAFSIFRKLTPEGQLEGVRRAVKRINEKAVKKGGKPKYSEADQTAIMDVVDEVREEALRQLERDGNNGSIGSKLADIIDKNKNPPPKKPTSAEQRMLKDLEAFAKVYMDKKKPQFKYSAAKALESFLINKEQYEDAWNEARWKLQEKYADNPEMLDVLHDFMVDNIGLEQIEKGIDGDIAKALRVFGIKPSSLVSMSAKERADVAKRVVRNLMMDNKLSPEDSAKMEKFIVERFENRIAQEEERIATRSKKKKRDHGLPAEDWLQEIGNEVAKALGEKPKPQGPKPISKTIKQDILRFVDDKYKQKNKTQKRSALDTLTDFLANRDEYIRAWDAARETYRTKYDDDAEGFAGATMTFNGIGSDKAMTLAIVEELAEQDLKKDFEAKTLLGGGRDVVEKWFADTLVQRTGALGADETMIRDAVKRYFNEKYDAKEATGAVDYKIQKELHGIKMKMSGVIRSSPGDKAAVAKRIADMMVKDYGIKKEVANTVATNAINRFNAFVAERSQKALKSMFEENDKKPPKTVMQRFAELANLGAFTNSNYREAASEKLFGEGVTVDEGLAQKFLDAKTEQEREAVLEEIYQDIGSKLDTTFGEVANQWRYTTMLLNPSTHIKNFAGNTTQLAEATVKDAVATVGEIIVDTASKVVRKGKGIQRTKAFLNIASEADRNLLKMAEDDYANVRDEIMGVGKYRNTPEGKINQYKTTMKLNDPQTKVAKAVDAMLRGAGKIADRNSTAMDVVDTWFSKPRYQAALAGYMKANGLTEITAEARKYAITEAQKSTYRDANAISDWARSLGHSKFKPINFFVNAIFPFKATPANVGVRAWEYSPAGLISTIAKGAVAAHRGEFSAASFIDDLSANITGSALAGVGIWLAQQGILRAKGTGDKKEREQLEAEGYEQNSVTLFDQSIPISAFGAASVPLLLGGAIYENFIADNPDEQGHPIDDFLDALGSTLDPVAETTMLTGLQDAVRDFQQYDPDAGLSSMVSKGLIHVAGNYIASFIPTLLSKTANATDTAARRVYIDRNKDAQEFQGEVQAWMKKIPGLRQQLTEQVDAYGNTVDGGLPTDGTPVGNMVKAILGAISPTYGSEIKTTAQDEELRRLYRADGVYGEDYSLLDTEVPTSFEANGKTVYLTGDQWEQYAKNLNGGKRQIRDSIMENERYADLPDYIRAAAMTDAKNYANALAKAGLGVGYKIKDKWMNDLAGATPEEVAEAIIQRCIGNAAGNENRYENKYLGLSDMLEDKIIDDQLALAEMADTPRNAYTGNLEGTGITVQQFLDVYGTAQKDGKTTDEKRQIAEDMIRSMDIDDPEVMGTFIYAMQEAMPVYIPMENKVSNQTLADIGDIGRIESQMGEEQRERYDKYIKNSSIEIQTYLDAKAFFDNYDADENGGAERPEAFYKECKKVTKNASEAKALFLGFYAESTWEKQKKKHG